MKKHLSRFLVLSISILIALCLSTSASAKVEWNFADSIALENSPLDIAISSDGETVYILCENNILFYSTRENKITDTIPLTEKFSQIAITPDGERLLLTDSQGKQISIIQVTQVYDIEVGQSPIIGKTDAPVNIFLFLDFQ